MHIISDTDLFQRLVFDNPWWKFTPETEIRFRHPPKRPFFYSFRTRVLGGAERIIVLAGPLGAGKTVMVHQMIAGLIEGGVSPQAVFYCNMTVPIYTAADIPALLEMFCRRYHHDETAEIYVFYDEIQYVSDWRDVVMRLAWLGCGRVRALLSPCPQPRQRSLLALSATTGMSPPWCFLHLLFTSSCAFARRRCHRNSHQPRTRRYPDTWKRF